MKKILFAVMLVAVFAMVAMAQTPNAPVSHTSRGPAQAFHGTPGWGNPPAAAAKLIFYGGDSNPSDPNVNGFANGNTILVPDTTTYGAVTAPKSGKVVATGVLFAHVMRCYQNSTYVCTGEQFDPATGTYDIRTGVAEGSGGTDLVSGSGPQTATATGRSLPFGNGASLPEYDTSVAFTKPVTPKDGTTYFINESPQCTDSSNENCTEGQYFFDNTTEETNGINANLQPSYDSFFNSAFFGYTWANTCDLVGGQSPYCEWQSWGVYGTP